MRLRSQPLRVAKLVAVLLLEFAPQTARFGTRWNPRKTRFFSACRKKMRPNKDKSEISGVQMRIEAKVLGFFGRNLKYDAARNT
jgi:hypothetical protein